MAGILLCEQRQPARAGHRHLHARFAGGGPPRHGLGRAAGAEARAAGATGGLQTGNLWGLGVRVSQARPSLECLRQAAASRWLGPSQAGPPRAVGASGASADAAARVLLRSVAAACRLPATLAERGRWRRRHRRWEVSNRIAHR